VQTQAIKAVGGFMKERIVGEDADLMIRLGTLPRAVLILKPGTYGYRSHAGKFSLNAASWSAGALALIRRFDAGVFPGGEQRRREARKIVSFNTAFGTLFCMKHGAPVEGVKLYLRTFCWQFASREYSYLLKTPFRLVLCFFGLWPLRAVDRDAF
jgi:hypothetical protein